MAKPSTPIKVEALKHLDATRKNIPTAEYQSVMQKEHASPIQVAYERRNKDLDPQLVWRGKDMQDWSDLVVQAPPLYIQEKVHPKVLIDDLLKQTSDAKAARSAADSGFQPDLFGDFNGVEEGADKTDFYHHDSHWTNRMILGDSLQVMASLAVREGLRGKVQCIYLDPPYGIKFNSNFQWSTTNKEVKDGKQDHITREPEQVKAFRDTWRDGIHSYLTYLRDRLTAARDLLTDSGSIFVQIGDENLHLVRAIMDEVFGSQNVCCVITYQKTGWKASSLLSLVADYILWYSKDISKVKYRQLWFDKSEGAAVIGQDIWIDINGTIRRRASDIETLGAQNLPSGAKLFRHTSLTSAGPSPNTTVNFSFRGTTFHPGPTQHWKTTPEGLTRAVKANRLIGMGNSLRFVNYLEDFPVSPYTTIWTDTVTSGFSDPKIYVVQTSIKAIQRCILMATDPGDLVLDPTCGSGTTATVAEQWGRRWITIDTSRVALALARSRIMGARYPYYLLADSLAGKTKEAEITRTTPSTQITKGDLRHGFVYERVPHIMLSSFAHNAEIDVIWERFEISLEPLRLKLNMLLGKNWDAWEIPSESEAKWPAEAKQILIDWWQRCMFRQKEIDTSIAAKAGAEQLYDKPYEDKKIVRVAGPFTVESISPHRVLGVDENDELIDGAVEAKTGYTVERDFPQMILENLRSAGVQQAHKDDRITFTSLSPWPGTMVCAKGIYREGGENGPEKTAAIFIGPEFGTVSRPDLVEAAKEAGDGQFDVLITCAFNYDARSADFSSLGRIPVLKARMNADLHMADDLKNSGKGNLFVIFGEPDIAILNEKSGQIRVKVKGVDVFHPSTGEIHSDTTEGIACWFIDTDYNEESFFVRHAYFLGQNDPYNALKTTLKAEINQEAWESLHSDTSRPFDKPQSGRIAVKVINHLGDEVMKVFKV